MSEGYGYSLYAIGGDSTHIAITVHELTVRVLAIDEGNDRILNLFPSRSDSMRLL